MIAFSPEANLLVVWVTFLVLGLAGLAAALVWAVRKGQFRDQDRARYLALTAELPDDGCPSPIEDGGDPGAVPGPAAGRLLAASQDAAQAQDHPEKKDVSGI